jgi:hypothetical protein
MLEPKAAQPTPYRNETIATSLHELPFDTRLANYFNLVPLKQRSLFTGALMGCTCRNEVIPGSCLDTGSAQVA